MNKQEQQRKAEIEREVKAQIERHKTRVEAARIFRIAGIRVAFNTIGIAFSFGMLLSVYLMVFVKLVRLLQLRLPYPIFLAFSLQGLAILFIIGGISAFVIFVFEKSRKQNLALYLHAYKVLILGGWA